MDEVPGLGGVYSEDSTIEGGQDSDGESIGLYGSMGVGGADSDGVRGWG